MAFCHTEAYARAIAEVYRYPRRDVRGMPLFRIGGVWTLTPFSEYGVEADSVDEALVAELPRPFLLKLESDEQRPSVAGLATKHAGRLAHLDLELELPEEEFFQDREHQVRKAVRKAGRAGWTVRVEPLAAAGITEYHLRHVRYMRDRHGSPPLSRRHFEAMVSHLGDAVWVARAVRGDEVGAWLLGYADEASESCQISEILTVPEALPDRAADLVHWGFVAEARRRGLARFDFGICRYEGQERYKKKWGVRFRHSLLLASDPRALPADPERPPYPLLRALWKRMPLALHGSLGPHLRRRIGM